MARGKRTMYRTVNAFTTNLGEVGDQVLVAKFDKIDAQNSPGAYCKTVKVSALYSDEDGGVVTSGTAGFMCYLTTAEDWSDDYIITAAGLTGGGDSCWLSARRWVRTDAQTAAQTLGSDGPIFLWIESTDIGDVVQARIVIETIGRYLETTEIVP